MPETDVYDRVHSLGLPSTKVALVGSRAIEVVVGPEVRRGKDTDLVVTPDVYTDLRSQHGFEERVDPNDGYRRLVGDGFDISVSWGGRSAGELHARGYVHNGVAVAGLPDIYEYKQDRGLEKDTDDLATIRERLYGDHPLPPEMLQNELEFVQGFMPEHLRARKELEVAANGLLIVRTVFGHEAEGTRTYTGTQERDVPALGHAWQHSAYGARDGQRNMDVVEARAKQRGTPVPHTDDDRIAVGVGYANHDAILGHGRQAVNPEGHDERQAADLVVRHLEAIGVTDSDLLEKTHTGVIVTTYNEAKFSQDIDPKRGHMPVQHNNAGSDLSAFRRPDAPVNAIRMGMENFFRVSGGYGQPLKHLLEQINSQLPEGEPKVRVRTVEDAAPLIDQYPDYPVFKPSRTPGEPPTQMTLREALADSTAGSAVFIRKYGFPSGWELGDPQLQAESADFMDELSRRMREDGLGAVDAVRAAQEYAVRKSRAVE
jgi:hypothetical protein